jgi:hypothetical protein
MTQAGNSPTTIQVRSVDDLANSPAWTGNLAYEDPTDKKHRIDEEKAENRHKRWRSTALFTITLISIIAIYVFCVAIMRDQKSSPEDKKWATAAITSITTGLIGFATGKAIA